MRPRILDLFCGAGGAGMGYYLAGLDVIGVDIAAQRNYPFKFHRHDALDFNPRDIREQFDAVHASPPCQAYSVMSVCRPGLSETYPDLIEPTRSLLEATGLPYVIENVPRAPLRPDIVLCGCHFGLRSPRGLGVRRPRWFETNWSGPIQEMQHRHDEPALPITGHSPGKEWRIRYSEMGIPGSKERKEAMGVEWMNRNEATEAIPPAFTEYIGRRLLDAIQPKADGRECLAGAVQDDRSAP